MEEVTDEPLYRDRVCGIEIGKAQMVAMIRMPSDRDPARRHQETRSFGTTKRRCWSCGLAAVLAGARGGDVGNQRLLLIKPSSRIVGRWRISRS